MLRPCKLLRRSSSLTLLAAVGEAGMGGSWAGVSRLYAGLSRGEGAAPPARLGSPAFCLRSFCRFLSAITNLDSVRSSS